MHLIQDISQTTGFSELLLTTDPVRNVHAQERSACQAWPVDHIGTQLAPCQTWQDLQLFTLKAIGVCLTVWLMDF